MIIITDDQAAELLTGALLAITWPGAQLPVVLPNRSRPTSGEFVTVDLRLYGSAMETMGPVGTRRWVRHGQLSCVVFVPGGTGLLRANQVRGAIGQALLGNDIGGVVIDEFHDGFVGPHPQHPAWFCLEAIAVFRYNTRK